MKPPTRRSVVQIASLALALVALCVAFAGCASSAHHDARGAREVAVADARREIEHYRQQQSTALSGVQTDTSNQMKRYSEKTRQSDAPLGTRVSQPTDPERAVPYDDILRYPANWPEVRNGEVPAAAPARTTALTPATAPTAPAPEPLEVLRARMREFERTRDAASAARVRREIAARQPKVTDLVPPQSLPAPNEELWIIQKPDAPAADVAANAQDDLPGSGALMAKLKANATPEEMVPVPLKHTDVKAHVAGYVASVDVTQQFHNPYDGKIEAVYVFPLPGNAAVNEFLMTVGDRTIRGIIREREEAKRVYEEAKSQGYVASLLTQERPNVFAQSVANIEPGKRIDITVRYFNTLAYTDGWYEFAFPMVVGPRFNPPGMTDGIGAVGQGARGASGQKTEVTYLRPNQRSGHDIGLTVTLDPGVAVGQVVSTSHAIMVQPDGAPRAAEVPAGTPVVTPAGSFAGDRNQARSVVRLAEHDAIPNRDFVLRYQVAGDKVKTGLIAQRTDKGGYFTLMLIPPADLSNLPRKPLEFVFTIDVSGSMNGRPIEQAKAAVRSALSQMRPDDTFQVVKFAGHAEQLSPQPLAATPHNVRAALRYIDASESGGGTMMLEGMRKSLDFPHDPSRLRFVAFLTDGYIGNEAEILGAMHGWLGSARVFSFGVGSSVNRYLLDGMAKMGNGAAAYLGLNDQADAIMADYFGRISHPAMTDLQVDFGGMNVKDVYPRKLPDLFVGRPVILTGKFEGDQPATIKVRGKAGNETVSFDVPVRPGATKVDAKALPAVWARMKIADLADRATYEGGTELAGEVKQVALEYGLMSSFTAFVAVDSLTRTAGDHGTTVGVAVPVPDGVKYETTVTDAAAKPAAGAERR